MGKSTLLNALVPGANAATREISEALDTGKHTTTHARLYHLDAETHLIDSPGLQEFGLHHLDLHTLEAAFRNSARISVAAASATATTTASPIARCAAHWLAAKSTRGDSRCYQMLRTEVA